MSSDDYFLYMWTIYKRPRDFPNGYIARLWRVGRKGAVATDKIITAQKIDTLRESLPPGLVRLRRDASDDPKIVEVWI